MEHPSSWLLIDDHGAHPVALDHARAAWARRNEPEWPAFSRLILDVPIEDMIDQVSRALGSRALLPWDAHTRHEEDLWVRGRPPWTWVEEPWAEACGSLHGELAERLARACHTRGAFIQHDPCTGQLSLSLFDAGHLTLAWCDAPIPGPSFSLTFHQDGSCTHEDPRFFALRALHLPESIPWLDRYVFIESMLQRHGLDPENFDAPPEHADLILRTP